MHPREPRSSRGARKLASLTCLLLFACADDGASNDGSAGLGGAGDPATLSSGDQDGCTRGALEADLQAMPLTGPGVVDGELASGDYIVSTTYLALKPGQDVQSRFFEVLSPVIAEANANDGLMALGLAQSPECGTARTLTAWRDEASMIAFVAGDAHLAAMASVGELSRGGSMATHWVGSEDDIDWDEAARRAGDFDGPTY